MAEGSAKEIAYVKYDLFRVGGSKLACPRPWVPSAAPHICGSSNISIKPGCVLSSGGNRVRDEVP